ncbi:MAG: transglutaminase family protein [Rikenellaceae bacterium]
MGIYRYSYQTIVRFDTVAYAHHFLLRCTPRSEHHQQLLQSQLYLLNRCELNNTVDTFGNTIHYGSMTSPHDLFVVASSGVVECGEYYVKDSDPHPHFMMQSPMTHPSRELQEFSELHASIGTPLMQAKALCEALFNHMTYTPGSTSIETTAAQSFALGCGVCQDYAHCLLSLLRHRGIYARYVVGFLLGEGETHAWVEVWSNGGWYGVDPTHNRTIESWGYIKLAHARDAMECSVTRGVHRMGGAHTTQINVKVEAV